MPRPTHLLYAPTTNAPPTPRDRQAPSRSAESSPRPRHAFIDSPSLPSLFSVKTPTSCPTPPTKTHNPYEIAQEEVVGFEESDAMAPNHSGAQYNSSDYYLDGFQVYHSPSAYLGNHSQYNYQYNNNERGTATTTAGPNTTQPSLPWLGGEWEQAHQSGWLVGTLDQSQYTNGYVYPPPCSGYSAYAADTEDKTGDASPMPAEKRRPKIGGSATKIAVMTSDSGKVENVDKVIYVQNGYKDAPHEFNRESRDGEVATLEKTSTHSLSELPSNTHPRAGRGQGGNVGRGGGRGRGGHQHRSSGYTPKYGHNTYRQFSESGKPSICLDFLQGRCVRGFCRYIHPEEVEEQLTKYLGLTPQNRELCRPFALTGECKFGGRCMQWHPKLDEIPEYGLSSLAPKRPGFHRSHGSKSAYHASHGHAGGKRPCGGAYGVPTAVPRGPRPSS